ncbi:MAG: SDR family oxidoreductase [Proteobacteria bacterium]|nr:SDR family oxidoreductase [Pseudomonadota bacterium]
MSHFTILGATGTIGQRLVSHLRALGHDVSAPARGDRTIWDRPLGHAIYTIGITADFRTKPLDTVEAHVCLLREMLARADFSSLTYLSSTRVYGSSQVGREDAALSVDPNSASDLYNLSKLMGESLCLHGGRAQVRAVRLSNVIGGDDAESENFLPSLLREAKSGGILLRSALTSAKDYIHIDDVVAMLPRIAESGRYRLYNLASGQKISHREWTYWISARTGCSVAVMPNAPVLDFPVIDITRLREEFAFAPRDVLRSVFGTLKTDISLVDPE